MHIVWGVNQPGHSSWAQPVIHTVLIIGGCLELQSAHLTVALLHFFPQVTLPLLLMSLSLDEPAQKAGGKLFDNLLKFVSITAAPSQAQLLDHMTGPDEEMEGGGQ